MEGISEQRRRYLFIAIWVIATLFLGWQLSQRHYAFESPFTVINLIVMFLCTVALLILIPNPIGQEPAEKPTRKRLLVLLILLSIVILFAIRDFAGRPFLFALPVIAVLTLVVLKHPLEKREARYAAALALVAGVTGLGAGWITPFFLPTVWSILQVFLVLTGLLAGWSILQSTGLQQEGVGKSSFISRGPAAAFKSFMSGILLALPWAFLNVLLGASNGETWVKEWWQPVIALQPGIAEEAWGRILLVPLLFLAFRWVSRPRVAFTAALYVAAYWFAYLHTQGGASGIVSTALIGTLYALPVSYLCLYRDLETAIGWHFWVDALKFAFAFILFNS
ncbi:MAG TPA: hypothetical protein VLE49_06530 [Anaerolineales bacterium]|nr:hypothetical protein [Anaerolineales bacterium]